MPPLQKNKGKEVQFDISLKNTSRDLKDPFYFDILAQFVNIPGRITLHELFRLFKKMREALWDALDNLETFLT